MWLVLLLLLCLSPAALNQETGSCSQPQPLCCLGTNDHCKRGSCYCDEFCHVLADCCPDRHSLCNLDKSHAGSCPPQAEPNAVIDRASQNTKMVLQMVLRTENPPSPARSNLDWMQNMVQELLQTSLPGMLLSVSVKGIKKKA
ncbi:PREDICTED: somatomedin-B and thrombospondin type-1 domain-containing protein-like [Hipposideros armiger]|uniref:Somatomedin-B and thrombospondin type-1 domain-containing protein-like n=1 Tax=Hipposideros armiger TaxID=186990 RepID=A0A8B7S211_HIPAR|nr:PREDICTED: somatomedin-B and thrombospondin type-1 domain-containing protein-like [Hipposideros armiger]